jgi:hypothetical protein
MTVLVYTHEAGLLMLVFSCVALVTVLLADTPGNDAWFVSSREGFASQGEDDNVAYSPICPFVTPPAGSAMPTCVNVPHALRERGRVDEYAAKYPNQPLPPGPKRPPAPDGRVPLIDTPAARAMLPSPLLRGPPGLASDVTEATAPADYTDHEPPRAKGYVKAACPPRDELPTLVRWRQVEDFWLQCNTLRQGLANRKALDAAKQVCKDGLERRPRIRF